MEFKDKSLLELVEFWNKDWQKETAELENTNTMRSWDKAVNTIACESSELEILPESKTLLFDADTPALEKFVEEK